MFWKILKWVGTVAVVLLTTFALLNVSSSVNPSESDVPTAVPVTTPDTSNNKHFN
jgi:hypothetical protein